MHVLVPEVLRPVGKNASETISTFAEDLLSAVKALADISLKLPVGLLEAKATASTVLVQILRRRLALNELAQAGAKMLTSQSQVERMQADLQRVDLEAIRRESAWVTGCNDGLVEQVFDELKGVLDQPRGLSFCSHWVVSVVERVLHEALQRAQSVDKTEDDGELELESAEVAAEARRAKESALQTEVRQDGMFVGCLWPASLSCC
jgi:hypothetical protein